MLPAFRHRHKDGKQLNVLTAPITRKPASPNSPEPQRTRTSRVELGQLKLSANITESISSPAPRYSQLPRNIKVVTAEGPVAHMVKWPKAIRPYNRLAPAICSAGFHDPLLSFVILPPSGNDEALPQTSRPAQDECEEVGG